MRSSKRRVTALLGVALALASVAAWACLSGSWGDRPGRAGVRSVEPVSERLGAAPESPATVSSNPTTLPESAAPRSPVWKPGIDVVLSAPEGVRIAGRNVGIRRLGRIDWLWAKTDQGGVARWELDGGAEGYEAVTEFGHRSRVPATGVLELRCGDGRCCGSVRTAEPDAAVPGASLVIAWGPPGDLVYCATTVTTDFGGNACLDGLAIDEGFVACDPDLGVCATGRPAEAEDSLGSETFSAER
jgi:hypothetical protein